MAWGRLGGKQLNSCLGGISIKYEKSVDRNKRGRALSRTPGKGEKYARFLPRSLEENSSLNWNLLTKVTQSMSEIILKAISHGMSITKSPITMFRVSLSDQKLFFLLLFKIMFEKKMFFKNLFSPYPDEKLLMFWCIPSSSNKSCFTEFLLNLSEIANTERFL